MRKTRLLFSILTILSIVCLSACGTTPSESIISSDNHDYYTVQFDSQGGSEVTSQRVMANNPIVRPGNPTYDNHTFNGWYVSTTFNEETLWNFDVDRVTADMTLYASWKEIEINEEATESLTYNLIDGGYEVTGVGEEERIIIPSTYNGRDVIRIGASSFARKQITYVSIPDTVTSIGLNAFNNASKLQEVRISENSMLTTIENNAFSGNSSLESIYLPRTLQTLGSSVFNNASGLNSITVASANSYFYSTGNNLIETATQILIRGSNISIIPEGVKIIASAAFRRSQIKTINIPSTVETIERYVFDDATSLTEINVSEENNNYSSTTGVLYNKNQTTLITVPEGKTGIVSLPKTITEIPSFAFDGITTISDIFIPSSVYNIRSFAFRNSTAIIHYEGTSEEWNNVIKHSTWGGANLTIEYNSIFEEDEEIDVCTIYFSATGNTEKIANMIASYTKSDRYEITAAVPYTSADLNYNDSDSRTSQENRNPSIRPEIGSASIDLSEYEVIYLGYPIWWGKAPKIIYTFLDTYDLSGKIIIPFATSSSSSMGGSESDLHALEPNAIWITGHRFSSNTNQATINSWIDSIKY